jgi:hypothetical protein
MPLGPSHETELLAEKVFFLVAKKKTFRRRQLRAAPRPALRSPEAARGLEVPEPHPGHGRTPSCL